ncbi:MAG: endonuclease/exonuclease/phosphatase family protein [Candidatus Micrarchaeota archaeon]|nr:endonuclease/exonuclease/phosphatase family protein [Candidatus Micrarchaeota archaeon]
MKRLLLLALFALTVAILIIYYLSNSTDTKAPADAQASVRVAAWNLHFFGDKKANNETLLGKYAAILSKYDVIFLQEITDEDGTAFSNLCNKLTGYSCFTGSRAGRTNYKEEYGVIYNKSKVKVTHVWDFNPDIQNRWERPPLAINMTAANAPDGESRWIIFYVIHTKPADATNEIRNLEILLENVSYPAAVIGDLNADCSFYDPSQRHFKGWHWIIKDDDDTTVGNTNCAYDRIIANNKAYLQYKSHGIETNISRELSDHYLIWLEIYVD